MLLYKAYPSLDKISLKIPKE